MREFELIARYFAPLADDDGYAFGLRDDAALMPQRPGHDVVATVDAVVEGVHFLRDDPPDLVARKLLRVNLSDLAAKGAEPASYLLVTAFSGATDTEYVAAFAAGLAQDQRSFGMTLLGGDTVATPGPSMFSITAFGYVPSGEMIRRTGGRSGDLLYVSGAIGDSFLGLKVLKGDLAITDERQRNWVTGRYRLPQPRCELGRAVRGLVSACLDVSDGLVADAGHLAEAAGLACVIEADSVPLSPAGHAALSRELAAPADLLTGGDDYELLLAVPPQSAARFEDAAARAGTSVSQIGRMEEGGGVQVIDAAGEIMPFGHSGYEHFG